MRKRVLVVGTGSIGLRHARLLAECENLEVEVCDTRSEGLREAARDVPSARQWNDFEAALESKPELVFLATPPSSHAPLTAGALESGADVFCEKPTAHTAESAGQMLLAQRKTGRLLNIGYVQRFLPELIRARELIQDSTIGTPCYARYSVATLETLEYSRSRHQQDVFGAAALDYAYSFDTFWWIFQERPTLVFAKGKQVRGMSLTSNPNLISAVVDYSSELVAEIHIDYIAKPSRYRITFQGSEGYLYLDMRNHKLERGDLASNALSEEYFDYERDDIMRRQRDHFLDAAKGKHPVSTTAEDGLQSNLGVDALICSLKSGKPEPVKMDPSQFNTTGPET